MRRFSRVNKLQPCKICGKPDWCMYIGDNYDDAMVWICPRTPSDRVLGNAGYLHYLDGRPVIVTTRASRQERLSEHELQLLREKYTTTRDQLVQLSMALRIPVQGLIEIGAGYSHDHSAYTFPVYVMGDAGRQLAGISLRHHDGKKTMVRGSRTGLFMGALQDKPECLYITEGATDTSVLACYGFPVVGRNGCHAGFVDCARLIACKRPSRIVIIADVDQPGLSAAFALQRYVLEYNRCRANVVVPPVGKDVREYYRSVSVDQFLGWVMHIGGYYV